MTHLGATELKHSWDRIAARLRAELGDDLYSSWFARMDAEDCEDGRLVLSVPTRFLRNWIETHYLGKLIAASEAELGPLAGLQLRVRTRGVAAREPRPAAVNGTAAEPALAALEPQLPGFEAGSPLDPAQTFESFMSGTSNALAQAAAARVAQAEAGAPLSFNPLFIHSAAGLGKTHLLHAIAWRIRKTNPTRRVMLMTAERFMVAFIQALRQRDTLAFKDRFAAVDVLLIDDFQFLQGKAMQQEFCHTFNSLVDSKRQVVVAADVPPAQLDSIDQRMRSRLLGGLCVDIELPDVELKRAILRAKLAQMQKREAALAIEPEVIEFVAQTVTGGGREIEGALNRIAAHQQFSPAGPVSLDLAASILRDMSANPDQCRIRVDDILKVVGRHFNVARADLLSPRRARSVVMPRQIGMYLAKKLTARSLPEIGRRFGGRDHSTVLHAVRKIETQMKSDDRLGREVALLTRMVEQG